MLRVDTAGQWVHGGQYVTMLLYKFEEEINFHKQNKLFTLKLLFSVENYSCTTQNPPGRTIHSSPHQSRAEKVEGESGRGGREGELPDAVFLPGQKKRQKCFVRPNLSMFFSKILETVFSE